MGSVGAASPSRGTGINLSLASCLRRRRRCGRCRGAPLQIRRALPGQDPGAENPPEASQLSLSDSRSLKTKPSHWAVRMRQVLGKKTGGAASGLATEGLAPDAGSSIYG